MHSGAPSPTRPVNHRTPDQPKRETPAGSSRPGHCNLGSTDDTDRTDEENRAINQTLARRAAMHGHIVFLGVFDRDCVIQFGSGLPILSREDLRSPETIKLHILPFIRQATPENCAA